MKPLSKTVNTFDNLGQKKSVMKGLKKTVSDGDFLSSVELEQYNQNSKIVIDGRLTFLDVGAALMRIRDGRQYREEYLTFEECCNLKFDITRARGYEMLEAAATVSKLPQNVVNLLQNEGQAAALAKAPKKQRAKIIRDVAASGPVTAKAIADKIKEGEKASESPSDKVPESAPIDDKKCHNKQLLKRAPEGGEPVEGDFKEVVKDLNGDIIPDNIVEEYLRAEREGTEHLKEARSILRWLEKDDLTTMRVRGSLEHAKSLVAGIKIHQTKHVLCPKCHGKKCAVCLKCGFMSNDFATHGIGREEE